MYIKKGLNTHTHTHERVNEMNMHVIVLHIQMRDVGINPELLKWVADVL